MEIIKIKPQGFCKGVATSINIVDKLLSSSCPKPIYMYGWVVHNKHIIDKYINEGIIITDNINDILSGTVIITAHGVSDQIISIFKSRNLNIIDTTCKEVTKTKELVKQKLNEDFTILYYGKKNHPECLSIISINDKIVLIESIDDIDTINSSSKLFFTNQTTMSYFDTLEIIDKLKKKFPSIIIHEETCTATKLRQEALIKQAKNNDLVIIVGDKHSNNSNMLKKVCDTYTNIPSIFIEDKTQLNKSDLSNYKHIAITSGASTPKIIVDEIIEELKK